MAAMTSDKACSAKEIVKEFNKSGVRVAWPQLADLLKVPPQIVHRILKKHEPAMLVEEDKSLTEVLNYWENNDPDHTWEALCLALLSDPVFKELGASLYSKQVKPDEFTLDQVYEEMKELATDPHEVAYVLIQDSRQIREIWRDSADEMPFEKCTRLAIDYWMKNNPTSSWLLLAKLLEWYIHGEREAAAKHIATTIRDRYLPKVDERTSFFQGDLHEESKPLEIFSAKEAFKELTAVEDWFGLGWFLKIEEDELKEIERNHSRDDDKKLAMLKLWVDTQPETASWNNLAFAVKKMPQHQSLALDIEGKLFAQLQSEMRERHLKEMHTQFFAKLIELLCDDQTHSSLVDQLASMSLISETDKEAQLSSVEEPKKRAISLLLLLDPENKPQHIIELVGVMKNIEKMKPLADEMSEAMQSVQYSTMESVQYKDNLPDVKVLAETNFQCSGDHAQTHEWKGYGLKLHVAEGSTASFIARVVHSTKFVLPEETELVSPIYWVTSIGDTLGPVQVEIQHCVDIRKDAEFSGLGSAIYIVEESSGLGSAIYRAEESYRFNMAECSFSHESRYGQIELIFSERFFALIRRIKIMLGWEEELFTARLYYSIISRNEFKAYLVIVPDVDMCLTSVQKEYDEKGYVFVGKDEFYFAENENEIILFLHGHSGTLTEDVTVDRDGWEITPTNSTKVSKKIVHRYDGSISSRTLNVKWCHNGEPPELKEKIVLSGSDGSIFLLLCDPPTQKGSSADMQQDIHKNKGSDPSSFWKLHGKKFTECDGTLRLCDGSGTTLMVFDTGIDENHLSFANHKLLLPQRDANKKYQCSYDDTSEVGHGTLCAGIACGAESEGTYKDGKSFKCRGVAPKATLGIWKAYTDIDKPDWPEWLKQLELLTEYIEEYKPRIDVLVISSGCVNYMSKMEELIKKLDDQGIIVVCAGSNYGSRSNSIAYPARFSEATICVGSNDHSYNVSGFSPRGEEMEFLALGQNIIGPKSKTCIKSSENLSIISADSFLICNGTSFAAPALGGLICLILQALNSRRKSIPCKLDRRFILKILKRLTNEDRAPRNSEHGWGAIDERKLHQFFVKPGPDHFIQQLKNNNEI